MSVMVTEVTRQAVALDPSVSLVANFGIVLIILLVILLVQKEFLRALAGPRVQRWLPTLDVAIVPLTVAAAILLFFRMLGLIEL